MSSGLGRSPCDTGPNRLAHDDTITDADAKRTRAQMGEKHERPAGAESNHSPSSGYLKSTDPPSIGCSFIDPILG